VRSCDGHCALAFYVRRLSLLFSIGSGPFYETDVSFSYIMLFDTEWFQDGRCELAISNLSSVTFCIWTKIRSGKPKIPHQKKKKFIIYLNPG
jgi:hypothetical protein